MMFLTFDVFMVIYENSNTELLVNGIDACAENIYNFVDKVFRNIRAPKKECIIKKSMKLIVKLELN